MTVAMKILYRVVRSRVNKGENLADVLKAYPKLTEEDQAELAALFH